jgi:hypothetical protein
MRVMKILVAGGIRMKQMITLGMLFMVALSACAAPAATQESIDTTQQVDVTVFKAPN